MLNLSKSILGMNARNLQYISKYNSLGNKKFADDKLFTKKFLESRGIGVAKLFHVIKNYRQLNKDFFESLPETFVIKPNRGLAGQGILVIVKKKDKTWVTAGGKVLDYDFLYRHCIEILEGKYSISGVTDQVIFEEKLDPHPDFRKICEIGLPDVRVVVFNLVPVMAMIRVPTYESDGKANMELGAVAMGIDMGTGKTTGAAKKNNRVSKMPTGASTKDFQVPYWDEILLSVAKIQESTQIGYLGVDLVITKSGVKVLEINARPGLKIQVANHVPLRRRLDKVVDLKVKNAEEGVSISKTLFSLKGLVGSGKEEDGLDKPIIGIREWVVLNSEVPQNIIADARLDLEKNIVNEKHHKGTVLDITLGGKRMKIPVEKGDTGTADVFLSRKFLQDFYIDPNKKFNEKNPPSIASTLDERVLRNVDEKVCDIDEQIKLLSYFTPKNLADQQQLFLENPEFSPRFIYKECELDIEGIKRDLKRIPVVDHPLYPLYQQKIESLVHKLDVIDARGSEGFADASKMLFGEPSRYMYKEAVKFMHNHPEQGGEDTSEEFDTKSSIALFQEFLDKYKLTHWKIKMTDEAVVDIQVTKKNSIIIKKGATFKKNRLEALMVHEIGTHVFRYENGKLQPLRIMERGTANYLQTEEGIAVWNQNFLGLHLGSKFFMPALLVVAASMGQKMSFVDLYHYLQETYNLEDEVAWKLCLKVKRGLHDTAQHGCFTKDILYFYGYREVDKYMKKGGEMKDLYYGKYALEDLPLVQEMEGLVKPKLLL